MEKEDQLIKELIQEGLLKSAPDDFTDNVMMAVSKSSQSEKSISDFSIMTYALLILGSISLSAGAIYFFTPSFLKKITNFFGELTRQIFFSFSNVFNGTVKWNLGIELNSMIIGVVFIMVMLLVADSFLGKRRKHMNLFV